MKKLISIMLVSVLILATSTVYADELSDGIVENEIGNPEVDSNVTENTVVENIAIENTAIENTAIENKVSSSDQLSSEENDESSEVDKNIEKTGYLTGTNTDTDTEIEPDEYYIGVRYAAHVQNIGWQNEVSDGTTSGTTGRGLQIEAINIVLDNSTSYLGGISYASHIKNIGWQNAVSGGNISGTVGRNLQIEAIKMHLTGELSEHFDIYYRTHIADVGWMPWTKNGQISGSIGLADRVEALEIRIIDKNELSNKPEITSEKSYLQGLANSYLTYSSHVQDIGNMPWVSGGNITGTTGRKLRIEGININLSQDTVHSLTGTIMYRTHVQDIGWTGWKTLGQYSGTSGRAKQVEAIEIKLTGQLATFYNIYYSSHIENYGWLGWASNGQTSGSTGISYRVEALRINLVRKGAPAPGSVANYYKNKPVYTPKPAALDVMSQNAQVRASSTRWLIMTDTSACQVGVYSGSYGNWSRVALWSCGPGKPSTPTVKGEFTIYGRGKSFGSRYYTCWYYTQFYGNYLFHSVLYNRGSMTQIQDGTLGKQVSHGCVRLDINNAKWLYDNIPNGTKVVIY